MGLQWCVIRKERINRTFKYSALQSAINVRTSVYLAAFGGTQIWIISLKIDSSCKRNQFNIVLCFLSTSCRRQTLQEDTSSGVGETGGHYGIQNALPRPLRGRIVSNKNMFKGVLQTIFLFFHPNSIPDVQKKGERSIFVTLEFENIAYFDFHQIKHCLLERMIPRSYDLVR